jgi:hypothetical protein
MGIFVLQTRITPGIKRRTVGKAIVEGIGFASVIRYPIKKRALPRGELSFSAAFYPSLICAL